MGICVECDKLKCEVCSSMGRHPAGKSVQSPEELGWALATAGRLGEERERERIIKLLEAEIAKIQARIDSAVNDSLSVAFWTEDIANLNRYIALIKGENK